MKQYLDVLRDIRQNGVQKGDRTGTGTLSVFGRQMRFDLSQGFPAVTTKKLHLKSVIVELLWFLRGDTNIQYLVRNGVNIWNEWAFQVYLEKNNLVVQYPRYSNEWKTKLTEFVEQVKTDDSFAREYGDLGPVYGKQWVRWGTADGREINQIQEAINMIRTEPTSRRIIVNAWNVGEIEALIHNHHHAPPSCHTLFQFVVMKNQLSCQLYQRTADMFLGIPFNIASYALLTMMVAEVTGLQPGEFIHVLGDTHIYLNHLQQVDLQLSRDPRPLPQMLIKRKVESIFDYRLEDFDLTGYNPHPAIKAPIAV